IAFFTGLVLGSVALWLILRATMARTLAETKAELQSQIATLVERVSAKEQQLARLQSSLNDEENQKTQVVFQLQEEASARASAEEKCTRIPELEGQLGAREEQINALQKELTDLKSIRAGL